MNVTLVVNTDHAGERLDSFLAHQLPAYSRSYWQRMCEQGNVLVNNQSCKSNHKLKVGEPVTIITPEQSDFSAQTLPILYQDDDVLVINKPAGLLTHAKGAINEEFTVAEFVRPRTHDGTDTNRPGIVHRLDRGTSGIIIAAKQTAAKHWLQKQFSKRNVKKTYIALVEGHLNKPQATLKLPIERNPSKPQTFRVGANGKPAETMYETLEVFKEHTLVALHPLTGRTHQLRVHMAYLGHPIVGDVLYGHAHSQLGRLFLHATELELTLPSRQRKVFHAPLPEDLAQYIKTL